MLPFMVARRITPEMAWQIRQEYEQLDSQGRRRYSMMELAARWFVSETTVYRAVHNYGKFAAKPLPEVQTNEQLSAAAKASFEKFKAENPDLAGQSASERMAAEIAAARGRASDQMLGELTEGSTQEETGNGREEEPNRSSG